MIPAEQPEIERPAPPSEEQPPLTEEQAAAEAALARLEDRIGAFTSYTLAADFLELREIYTGTLERIEPADWSRRTERRPNSWTLRQTLAHVAAVAETYNAAVAAGLEGRPVEIPGFETRRDLRSANLAALAARTALSPEELSASFLGALDEAARLVAPLEPEHLGRLVPVPFFDGTPTVAELFGCSLVHAGIIHGAQLAATRARPIWIFFQPGLMRRQLTRFFHNLGLAYWPERGGDLHATIAFNVAGQGGGSWFVRARPDGGQGRIGVARTRDVTFDFASADLLCRIFTFQTPPWRALLTRQLRVHGNLRLAARLPQLFTPT
jgi:hypothetical protein